MCKTALATVKVTSEHLPLQQIPQRVCMKDNLWLMAYVATYKPHGKEYYDTLTDRMRTSYLKNAVLTCTCSLCTLCLEVHQLLQDLLVIACIPLLFNSVLIITKSQVLQTALQLADAVHSSYALRLVMVLIISECMYAGMQD